jgi:osmotically-inducible protein OsmY
LTERARHLGHGISERAGDATGRTRDAMSRAGSTLAHPRSWFGHEDESHVLPYAATGMGTLLLGAGLMYLLDPQRGRQRRALITDKATSIVNRTGRTFRQVGKDLSNRARGVAAESRGMVAGRFRHGEPVSADQLLQRVRSEMGHVVSHPAAVQVMTDNAGTVTLHGRVLASEADRLLAAVKGVGGVEEVVNLLSVQDTVEGVAGYDAGGTGSTSTFSGATGATAPQL